MNDLASWLRQQLDDDERIAKRVEPNQAPNELRAMVTRDGSPPFLVIDSARMLAEVDAKRRILELHRPVRKRSTGSGGGTVEDCQMCGHFPAQYPCVTIRLLALPYADRPGYRQEWAPTSAPA